MKKAHLFLSLVFTLSCFNTVAQSVLFSDDSNERGYYDRAYLRYEAETGKCVTNGVLLEPTYVQTALQSEASNQMATQLIAKESYVQWTNEETADGLTIRFSIPDNAEGTGAKGTLALYVNDTYVQNIDLDSYWAWQYFLKTMSNPYPDNTPGTSTKFPRMRFDETHVKLSTKIPAGAVFKLVKTEDNDSPYTIDFVELEDVPAPVTFESIPGDNKVEYSLSEGTLASFISKNTGKIVFIPAGKYNADGKITINGDNTQLIGAGMWYTEIYFTASSDEKATYNRRGIETYNSHILIEGLYLNTVNNKRYYDNNDAYQVGKGLMGSFGSNSIIRNVWAEHFECGAWIEGADHLTVTNCRFRNNYADGINLAYGSKNSIVEHCSFRNNGDDDMATWSRGSKMCENITYRYCTAENNWRASSLGFFGGKENKAYHCVIMDPMEAGFRVTCDFPGMPFSTDGYSEFHDISVYKGGVKSGVKGENGDLWGNQQGAVHINSSSNYDLQNIKIYNIDLYDSKNDALFIGSGNSRSIKNLQLKDIHIDGTGRYGIYFSNARGNGQYCRIEYENTGADTPTNALPAAFNFVEDCSTAIDIPDTDPIKVVSLNGTLVISGFENTSISVYDLLGRKNYQTAVLSQETTIPDLPSGIYIVKLDCCDKIVKVII
jgi:parallel beta-helix repeat protein